MLCLCCQQRQAGAGMAHRWHCCSSAAPGAADDVLCGRCHAASYCHGWRILSQCCKHACMHRATQQAQCCPPPQATFTCSIPLPAARTVCHHTASQPQHPNTAHSTTLLPIPPASVPPSLPPPPLPAPTQLPLATHIKLCALELPLVLACLGLQLAAALVPAATTTATTTGYPSYPLLTPLPAFSSLLLPAFWHHLLLPLLCHALSGVLLPALIIRLSTTSLRPPGSDSYSYSYSHTRGYSYSYGHPTSSHAGTEAGGGTHSSLTTSPGGGWAPQRASYDSTKSSSSAAR